MAEGAGGLRDVVRQLLKADNVKLWLEPYTSEDGFSAGTYDPAMVGRYAEVSGASQADVIAMLETLRQHAISKLSQRRAGLESASKVEVGEQLTVQVRREAEAEVQVLNVTASLDKPGAHLHGLVAKAASLRVGSFRIVHCGQVVDDVKLLREQGVCAGSVLMTLPISAEEQREISEIAAAHGASRVRNVASSLAGREDDGVGPYVDICDQQGRPIDLPSAERRALTLALTLHQKGRAMLRRASSDNDLRQALAVLVEGDREFSQCSAKILSLVDNYAVLCLDICWCQLLLRETGALPEAEHRLANCETTLRKTYGKNMERLALHKQGNVGAEKLLLGRLHLLQAVVAHFTGRPNSARELVEQSKTELSSLQVSSEQLGILMSMSGCSEQSARIALRACGHDIQRAALSLMEKAEMRKQSELLVAEQSANRKRARALGRIANGSACVNVDMYDKLCSMGFPPILCKLALRQCNNNMSASLIALQESRDTLEAAALDEYRQQLQHIDHDAQADAEDGLVQQGLAMGFDESVLRAGLRLYDMQLQPLIDHLLSTGGILDECHSDGVSQANGVVWDSAGAELARALQLDPEIVKAVGKKGPRKRSHEEDELAKAIKNDLVPDLEGEGDEYLDSTLEKEFELLEEYRTMIYSI
ncbi:NEDD8 ultimate buster 1-like [Sycon ciliatum]|uniref:NEDD8 ultimate buster 1-like n=1 Tax=Sycon ciliatum TaxID=27933 RepID=UPI0020AB93A8|eukprot:scpid36184/ scgid16289/ NEDD8 ultimate buster 1; Negative regulator of ubiquitin-like proteins 1; Protein BS4